MFLTERPAIIALYVSLGTESFSAGGSGGGGMIGGLTIAGTFLWPSSIPDLAGLMVSGFCNLLVPAESGGGGGTGSFCEES